MADDVAIRIDHVSKTFKLPHEKQTSIKGALISRLRGGSRSFERQEVLKDISFEIKKGEFFGIVGRNGSGKSTLLKMLAGIYTPTKGGIQVNGKLTPFIELGVGFNPELTGRENVFLNGALLGFNRTEMAAMYDDIVEFAELEKFMDQKLKNYSSGMQVRLAFSIAIRAKSDILLIDEVLAVGDAAFQLKCFDYFEQLKEENRTVVLVSHDMGGIKRFCTNAILIDKGKLLESGDVEEVTSKYALLNRPKETQKESKSSEPNTLSDYLIGKVISEVTGDKVKIALNYRIIDGSTYIDPIIAGVSILDERGVYICGFNNSKSYKKTPRSGMEFHDDCIIDVSKLFPGNYLVNLSLYKLNRSNKFELVNHKNYVSSFSIKGKQDLSKDGAYNIDLKWGSAEGGL